MANTSTFDVIMGLEKILTLAGSFNLYMAHGGTNFGFWNGANGGGNDYSPVITSYDYNAPISESGDHGYGRDGEDKFSAIQDLLTNFGPLPPEPKPNPKMSYGTVQMTQQCDMLSSLSVLSKSIFRNQFSPKYMEQYGQNSGFILYTSYLQNLTVTGSDVLLLNPIRDRIHVKILRNKLINLFFFLKKKRF